MDRSRTLRHRRSLFLELLEARSLLATITVDSPLDTFLEDDVTTLREAIFVAHLNPAADTIEFAPSLAAAHATVSVTDFDTGLDANEAGPSAFIISTPIRIQGPFDSGSVTIAA